MAFVHVDLGATDVDESDEEVIAQPQAKKKRGPNVKYLYLEIAESLEEVHEKAKAAEFR